MAENKMEASDRTEESEEQERGEEGGRVKLEKQRCGGTVRCIICRTVEYLWRFVGRRIVD